MKAPLLELKNIGKIYVSEGSVAVGIRGVSLSFESGEFVAVTGKSGSGKSTLLNVISGMDTYEEGELYVEGEPTSHFMQKDWEEYRKQYVSFIFQEYNILESFTVLQNVELALMHIDSRKERRARAMELIRRVGLEKHIHHKGSKLSGGQKQRTVIARALAKDSPIILADEPTGNLDSKTSEEIIQLLREVSKDKLVIVVTHNFEQVEAYATRHIRVYDGAVDRDQTMTPPVPDEPKAEVKTTPAVKKAKRSTLRNGLHLGWVRFCATPKLSIFLCILMTLAALVITLVTSLTADRNALFEDTNLITHVKGRTVVVRKDGAVITEEELNGLADQLGAKGTMRYDYLLDQTVNIDLNNSVAVSECALSRDAEDLRPHVGRTPTASDEVILELPLSYKPYIQGLVFEELDLPLLFGYATYTVVGVIYRMDNTITPTLHFTEEGYRVATSAQFMSMQTSQFGYDMTVSIPGDLLTGASASFQSCYVDFDLPAGSYFVCTPVLNQYRDVVDSWEGSEYTADDLQVSLTMNGTFNDYSYSGDNFSGYGEKVTVSLPFDGYTAVADPSPAMIRILEEQYQKNWVSGRGLENASFVVVSPDVLVTAVEEQFFSKAYTQASLFFGSDAEAHRKLDTLRELGYMAVVSDETVDPDELTFILQTLLGGVNAAGWIMTLLFTTLFMILCSSRAMNATRGDVAIMRSMGIPTGVVRTSIYVQTFATLIPAAVVTAVTMFTLYAIPKTNEIFHFLQVKDYAVISAVMLVVTWNLARRYVRKMFKQSVKKTMKGGSKA